jgi:hypothetical protein
MISVAFLFYTWYLAYLFNTSTRIIFLVAD